MDAKCNNCGRPRHIYKHCRAPITSIGIINRNDQGQYLMICRKQSLGYVEFLRGKYNVSPSSNVKDLIDEMTMTEKSDIVSKSFLYLWSKLWNVAPTGNHEEQNANKLFDAMTSGCYINDEWVTIASLVEQSTTKWLEPEWGFPKGRRNNYETDLACAIREYEEETGYICTDLKLFKNIIPYEEIFVGSNYKSYKHKYFVATSKSSVNARHPFQVSEVSALKWYTFNDALNIMRPYCDERKEVLTLVEDMLSDDYIICD